MSVKRLAQRLVQQSIRWGHHQFCSGPLPRKLGIYFHEIRRSDHPAIRDLVSYFRALGYCFTGDPCQFVNEPAKPIVFVSVDDNFRTSLELLEVAKESEFQFCLYLNTIHFRDSTNSQSRAAYLRNLRDHGADDDAGLLSKNDVRTIAAAGHTIGSHTRSHRQLTKITNAEAREEILGGKQDLETILGEPVKHFSYPFGMRRHFNESLREYCLQIGFETVANAIPGMLFAPQTANAIQRTGWDLRVSLERNLENLCIDGRWYESITGRSAVA